MFAFAVGHAFMYTTQLGGETSVGNPQMVKLKNVVSLIPIILIPITSSFSAVRGLTITWSAISY